MGRSLRTLAALAGFAMVAGFGSVPTLADDRAPEPREREPRLAPPRHASGRWYREPAADAYVSRQQRRAALRAQNFSRLTAMAVFGTSSRELRRRVAGEGR